MRREDALENNLTWNCTVLDAHGVGYESTAHWWLSKERVPPYRSNFVTRTPDATEEQLARIGELVAHPPAHRWSVADSFACLDTDALQDFGFALLFEAQWYGSLGRSDNREETDVLFAQVQDEDALAGWESRWQEWSPAPGQRVFPPTLLDVPGTAFWTAFRQGVAVGGAITHSGDHTLGLSNVFLRSESATGAFLRDAARLAMRVAGDRPVVGYGSLQELQDLAPLGFQGLGTQRVWLSDVTH